VRGLNFAWLRVAANIAPEQRRAATVATGTHGLYGGYTDLTYITYISVAWRMRVC
jgi:hypothetical protein